MQLPDKQLTGPNFTTRNLRMSMRALLTRIDKAVALESDDAAIRISADYQPQAGVGAKVFPPTYMEHDGTRYHFENRWRPDGHPSEVVILDSYQSQANRCEAALEREAAALGLPRIVMRYRVDGRVIEISSLEAPHRSRDAYFLDSRLGGKPFDDSEIGSALNEAGLKDLTPYLEYAPTDLVYGVWDSHRGKRLALKFARSYTSEILGWDPERGKRAATKGDPLNLPGGDQVFTRDWRVEGSSSKSSKERSKLSDLGHGMIPDQPDGAAGGVAVRAITRLGVLSLTGLARHEFGSTPRDVAGRTALAAIGLLGDRLAFGAAGIHLRSGSDLVLVSDSLEWVQRGGRTEPLNLSQNDARELFDLAKSRLPESGVRWSSEPLVVEPSQELARVIKGVLTAGGAGQEGV